jgi:hypothetical protein
MSRINFATESTEKNGEKLAVIIPHDLIIPEKLWQFST